jgi:hypothetical protein
MRQRWAWTPEMLALRERGLKRCSRCKEIKPATLEHFPKRAAAYDGLAACCRACGRKRGDGGQGSGNGGNQPPTPDTQPPPPPTQLRFA